MLGSLLSLTNSLCRIILESSSEHTLFLSLYNNRSANVYSGTIFFTLWVVSNEFCLKPLLRVTTPNRVSNGAALAVFCLTHTLSFHTNTNNTHTLFGNNNKEKRVINTKWYLSAFVIIWLHFILARLCLIVCDWERRPNVGNKLESRICVIRGPCTTMSFEWNQSLFSCIFRVAFIPFRIAWDLRQLSILPATIFRFLSFYFSFYSRLLRLTNANETAPI